MIQENMSAWSYELKGRAIEDMKEANLVLEAGNSKLQPKSEEIQQRICKERVCAWMQ